MPTDLSIRPLLFSVVFGLGACSGAGAGAPSGQGDPLRGDGGSSPPVAGDAGGSPDADVSDSGKTTGPRSVKAYYFGHSLLAGNGASPHHHLPYNVGVFALAKGHTYATHGQIGWGTAITAHWGWSSDDLDEGPAGFANENKAPFYAGHNGKKELQSGYDFVVFTDVNGNAYGAEKTPVVNALVGFVNLARQSNPGTQAILYSCWNSVQNRQSTAAISAWRDATQAQLGWWEGVADAVNERISDPPMLLVPVSVVVAQVALDAANGALPGVANASELFSDDVHGTSATYYAAGASVFTSMFQQSPVGATSADIKATVSGADVDYSLPSAQAATQIQQRAFEIVSAYPRAGYNR
jgi:hypothetical protein